MPSCLVLYDDIFQDLPLPYILKRDIPYILDCFCGQLPSQDAESLRRVPESESLALQDTCAAEMASSSNGAKVFSTDAWEILGNSSIPFPGSLSE